MVSSKLQKYIRDKYGNKVEKHTTSVNITDAQREFLASININLSSYIRDQIDALILETGYVPKPKQGA